MSTYLQPACDNLPIGSLDAYIARVNAIPMLSQKEEFELANRWQQHQDAKAAQRLVLSHLKYVVRVARGYMGYGLPLADLIQEGTVGLMKAVKRFRPEVGVRLVSFAVHWIKAEVHEYVIRNWRIVKVATTKAQRKLFFNLRTSKKRLGWFSAEEVEAVASDLGVPKEEVLNMEQRLNAHDSAFNLLADDDDGSHYLPAPEQYLESKTLSPEELLSRDDWQSKAYESLSDALAKLDERSQDILQQRWLQSDNKLTLIELAEKYGVSAERIRQIEKAAIKKLQQQLLPALSS